MDTPKQIADKLFKELNLQNQPPKRQQEVLEELVEHFSQVIITTMLRQVNDEQFADLEKALNSTDWQNEVLRIAGEVPGLAEAIENNIQSEYDMMKTVMNS